MKVNHSIASRLAAFALAAGAVVALTSGTPASASPSDCFGASCTDLDPSQTNCVDDAITIWSVSATVSESNTRGDGLLEMRYSPNCHANWVRYTPWAGVDDAVATILSGEQESGSPWIWRADVENTPRGYINDAGSNVPFQQQTKWTAMITADGTTCMSVDLYAYGDSSISGSETNSWGESTSGGLQMSGGWAATEIGTFNAGCIS